MSYNIQQIKYLENQEINEIRKYLSQYDESQLGELYLDLIDRRAGTSLLFPNFINELRELI